MYKTYDESLIHEYASRDGYQRSQLACIESDIDPVVELEMLREEVRRHIHWVIGERCAPLRGYYFYDKEPAVKLSESPAITRAIHPLRRSVTK